MCESMQPSKPVVTVVIPTYNHASFLYHSIGSVCCQTFTDWEVVIVNNYSEDDTESVVASFADERIRLVNFHNKGVIAASRNYGISLAQGDYIAFLDSDDVWYPEKLERCLSVFDAHSVDIVCHGELWMDSDGYRREVTYGPESRASYESLLVRGNSLSTSAVVVRHSLILDVNGFSESSDFITAEDYDLWLKFAKRGVSFSFLFDILGEYRIHPDGNSQAIIKNVDATLAVISHHFSTLDQFGFWKKSWLFRKSKARVIYGGGRGFQRQRNLSQAFNMFVKSICVFPFSLLPYVAICINGLPCRLQRL